MAGAVDPGYGFTGQQYDAETGLQYHRARYYDPEEERFLSTDPMGFPDGPRNAYVYVANTPYQKIDPTGLNSTTPWAMQTLDATIEANAKMGLIQGIVNTLALSAFNFLYEEMSGSRDASLWAEAGLPDRSERKSGCYPTIRRPERDILPTLTRTHGGGLHDRAINRRAIFLRAYNIYVKRPVFTDVTKNQQQKNRAGALVSTCRPDLQYNYYGAIHYIEEYFYAFDALATWNKARIMNYADPLAAQVFRIVGRRR
ncbi:MAG: RHS repeat-associated core domain-containing protein [Rhodobacteraceae bacterium]|nr:RHS repeat-associated core domain-containing protein [Paracoccaceae bacterium]